MPARNVDATVEKFLARFYPGLSGVERGQKSGEVRAWVHNTLTSSPMSTRKLEALYAEHHKDDPEILPRPKLGEAKKTWDYYVFQAGDIVAGPFVNRVEAAECADRRVEAEVITSTEARRKGYLERYKEVKALE